MIRSMLLGGAAPSCRFVRRGLLDEETARGMLAWPHSGFHVHDGVWVPAEDRAFEPGGKSFTTTCATEPGADGIAGTEDDEVICSTATLTMERTKGRASFINVSAELLFISIVVDPTVDTALAACLGITETQEVTLPLFHGCLENYFWNYDNQGAEVVAAAVLRDRRGVI